MREIKFKLGLKKMIVVSLLLGLSGCGTYRSSFNCGDAKGAYCASMDHVDQMIKSGEIERFNELRQNKKYKALKNDNELPLNKKSSSPVIANYEDDKGISNDEIIGNEINEQTYIEASDVSD